MSGGKRRVVRFQLDYDDGVSEWLEGDTAEAWVGQLNSILGFDQMRRGYRLNVPTEWKTGPVRIDAALGERRYSREEIEAAISWLGPDITRTVLARLDAGRKTASGSERNG